MRVLVGAIGHESNTFSPFLTRLEDFHPRWGMESLELPPRRGAFNGIVDVLRRQPDIELVPTVAAHAMPGGRVEWSAFERLKEALLTPAVDIDGVCLFLHGAMRAQGIDYAEHELLTSLRDRLGPDVPITVALDMHANIVRDTAQIVNALVAYHTAPHVDAYETGQKAATMLLRILRDGTCLAMGFAKVPFLLPGEKAQSNTGVMGLMMEYVSALEARPEIVSASLMNGHCWADVPDIGVAAVVVAEGDENLAQAEADRLATMVWERRAAFDFGTEAYPVDEAVAVAMAAPEPTVFLSDSGDNPGAGGTTDVTAVLESLLRQEAKDAVVASIWDAEAVRQCVVAGVGSTVSLLLGGKLDTHHGKPLAVTGRVRMISDGGYYAGGVRAPERYIDRGTTVLLTVGGVDVVITERRHSYVEPAQFHSLGLDPLSYKIVVVKRGYLTAPLAAICPRSILAISPGVTNCDVTQLNYRRVRRPIYPLDLDATWSPGLSPRE